MPSCPICFKKYQKNKFYLAHIAKHAEPKKVNKCEICSRVFPNKHKLKRHRITHTSPHKCHQCGLSCAGIEKLAEHRSSCSKRTFWCFECPKTFCTLLKLIQHKRAEHVSEEQPVLKLKCKYCLRDDWNVKGFVNHARRNCQKAEEKKRKAADASERTLSLAPPERD